MKPLIEKAKTGRSTLVYQNLGNRYPVYSVYDPQKDGRRFYGEFGSRGNELCIFLGIGLGYHITPFLEDPRVKKIVVLEPDDELFRMVRGHGEIEFIVNNKKVEIFKGKRIDRYIKALEGLYDYLFFRGIQVLSYPRIKKLFKERYDSIEQKVQDALSMLLNDGLTIGKFARVWVNNFFRNLGSAVQISLVSSLHGSWRGTTIVAGAGPSLDGVIGYLKKYRGNVYLIATDASVKPLVGNGVIPDIIVSIDPQPIVSLHFHGLPGDLLKGLPVVLNFLSPPSVFSLFSEIYIYFTLHPISALFAGTVANREDRVISCGAVSSLAFKLAVLMGFNQIILAGMDFAYTNRRAYTRHSFFYDYCIDHSWRLYTGLNREAEAIRSGTKNLDGYRGELESLIKETIRTRKITVFNWGSGGVHIENARLVSMPPFKGKPVRTRQGTMERLEEIPEVCRVSEIPEIALTLAIRNSVFKNSQTKEKAIQDAERYINKKCEFMKKRF
jgi:hypothetical protein